MSEPLETPACDRCSVPTPATHVALCWYGCSHTQCERCADATTRESQDVEVKWLDPVSGVWISAQNVRSA